MNPIHTICYKSVVLKIPDFIVNTVVLLPLQVTVPAERTYYHCKVMKVPKLNGKNHIYRVNEPSLISWSNHFAITSYVCHWSHLFPLPASSLYASFSLPVAQIEPVIEHLDLVHHMLLYGCPSSVNQTYEKKCYTEGSGEDCIRVVSAWGVGGGVRDCPLLKT